MARLNISQAARDWGLARSTVQRAIKNGHLAVSRDRNGTKYIDSSEMIRAYGAAATPSEDVSNNNAGSSDARNDTAQKLTLYKVHYGYLKRENKLQNDRINHLEKVIESQREMLMIMHRRLPNKQ